MSEHIAPEVYIELGAAGLSADEVSALISEAASLSAALHSMGAEGRIEIPKTKRVLVYNCGIDGMDWRVYIEDTEVKSADALVHEVLAILQKHDASRSFTYANGWVSLREWRKEAQRYIDAEDRRSH